jgi:hypothetical protein
MNKRITLYVSTIFMLCICLAAAIGAAAQTFGGRAVAVNAALTINGSASTTTFADTGNLPPSGGTLSATAPSSLITGVMSTGALISNASGILKSSQASSVVNDLDVTLSGGVRIRANRVIANGTCICCPGSAEASCTGGVQISSLTITDATGAQTTVTVTGQANQVVNLPGGIGTITINEQTSSFENISVTGLHIVAASGGNNYDIRVANATTHIACAQVLPTPANVVVSGHVFGPTGTAIGKASVTLTDANGNVRSTYSDVNGAFSFADVEAGHSYVIQVTKKGYSFDPVIMDVNDSVDVDIRGTTN